MTRKHETAAERDERILAEAKGKWCNTTRWDKPEIQGPHVPVMLRDELDDNIKRAERLASAAARVLNRIVRKWRTK